jgi:hypothetical protein
VGNDYNQLYPDMPVKLPAKGPSPQTQRIEQALDRVNATKNAPAQTQPAAATPALAAGRHMGALMAALLVVLVRAQRWVGCTAW